MLTTSEFWKPQISLAAAQIRLDDKTAEAEGPVPPSDFEVELKKVQFKYGDVTLLTLPTVRANGERPDVPIRSINAGYDNTFGATLETRWYLNRLLGLREPPGTNSTLSLDYYSKRGPGGGIEVNYEREDYFGSVLGYVIDDHGTDRLSRTREDVDVPEDLRGRFRLQHRQYLPDGWQLTAEVSYLSDQNFLEQFYRTEYNVGKEQETLLYLKRIQDNWGLAFLGKVRVNEFPRPGGGAADGGVPPDGPVAVRRSLHVLQRYPGKPIPLPVQLAEPRADARRLLPVHGHPQRARPAAERRAGESRALSRGHVWLRRRFGFSRSAR